MTENENFLLHEYVFAKVRGFRPWPAQIIHIENEVFTVLFFGSNDIMNVTAKDLESFNDLSCKKQMKVKAKNVTLFRKAVQEVQDRIDKFGVDTTDGTELIPVYRKEEPTESRSVVITYQQVPSNDIAETSKVSDHEAETSKVPDHVADKSKASDQEAGTSKASNHESATDSDESAIGPLTGKRISKQLIKEQKKKYPLVFNNPLKIAFIKTQHEFFVSIKILESYLGPEDQDFSSALVVLEDIKKNIQNMDKLMLLKISTVMEIFDQLCRFGTKSTDEEMIIGALKIKAVSIEIFLEFSKLFPDGYQNEQKVFSEKYRGIDKNDLLLATTIEDLESLLEATRNLDDTQVTDNQENPNIDETEEMDSQENHNFADETQATDNQENPIIDETDKMDSQEILNIDETVEIDIEESQVFD